MNTIRTHFKLNWAHWWPDNFPFGNFLFRHKSLFLCVFFFNCRGHVVGLTLRFDVGSQVVYAVPAQLISSHPQAHCALQTLLERKIKKNKNVVEWKQKKIVKHWLPTNSKSIFKARIYVREKKTKRKGVKENVCNLSKWANLLWEHKETQQHNSGLSFNLCIHSGILILQHQ